MNARSFCALAALVLLASPPLLAENVAGADRFLCAITLQEVCESDEPCTNGGPDWDTGIPEFLEFDVKKRTVSTTQASGDARSNEVSVRRDDGRVFIQGHELENVFSVVVNESSGLATASITADGEVIAMFGMCTPR